MRDQTAHTPGQDHFDLLPFIAILMCVLGCLLLVTVTMSAVTMGIGAGEAWIPASAVKGKATTRERPDLPEGLQDARAGTLPATRPVLVEWDGSRAWIHQDGRKIEASWQEGESKIAVIDGRIARQANGKLDVELQRLIDFLESHRQTHYVLFAVRPSGFENFMEFADEFRQRKINIGYEPIQQGKPVQLQSEEQPDATEPTTRPVP